jgi:phage tail sheath protein FI
VATPVDTALLGRLQIATLRMAGAGGDFFALLSLPRHFRTAEAAAHATRLAALAPGAGSPGRLGADEQRLLSFGALYHPWLVSRGNAGLVSSPPDGAIAGLMAARAQNRGAWIAPANDPVQDIVGLDPSLPDGELLALDRARVNMVRSLPMGFALHDADTLSNERDWRQINVRRLMMLLRRTLLRRGMTYVFEPNGPVLRRAVERSLTAMLDDLQQRGAFAGATSEKSFRIAVQQNDADIDAGRLIVEVAIAPSQPIRFLTLRLVQQGARLSILEEA